MRLFFRAVRAARVGADREFIAPPRLTPASPPNNLALNSLRFIMQYSFGRLGSLFAVTARQSCARPYAGLTDASDSEKASYRRDIHRRDVTWRPVCNLEVRVNIGVQPLAGARRAGHRRPKRLKPRPTGGGCIPGRGRGRRERLRRGPGGIPS